MSGNGKALRIHPPFSKYLKLTFDLKGVTEYLAFTLYMLHRYPWVSTAGTFSVCATANSQTSKPPIKSPPKKERPKLITVRQQISSHTLRDPRNLSLSTHTIDNHLLFHTIAPAPFIEKKGGAVGTCKKNYDFRVPPQLLRPRPTDNCWLSVSVRVLSPIFGEISLAQIPKNLVKRRSINVAPSRWLNEKTQKPHIQRNVNGPQSPARS